MSQLPNNIKRAMNFIVTTHYFYASILLKRAILMENIKTASMDVFGTIRINTDWTGPLTVQECVFLLCHECLHYMLSHCLRRGKRDPDKWNWAADAWINETLIKAKVGTFIEGGVRYPGAENMSVEELYLLAPNDLPKGEGGGSLGGDIDDSGKGGLEPSEVTEMAAKAKVEMAQAAQAAQQMGGLDEAMKKLVDSLVHVKTPWYRYLEQFMTQKAEVDYSWYTPDETFLALGIYLPGMDGASCGPVAIVSDESGSVPEELVEYFGGHVNTVLEACNPEKVYLLHTTTRVVHVDEYDPEGFPIQMTRRGRGCTDMTAGVDWVLKNAPECEAIIILTDGHTPFGDAECHIPTFWAITDKTITAPHGQTVHIDIND